MVDHVLKMIKLPSAEMMAMLPWAVASSELRPDPDNLESGQLLCFSPDQHNDKIT